MAADGNAGAGIVRTAYRGGAGARTRAAGAGEEEVPLTDLAQEKSKMSWWWLLIVAVCGATGYEMYKKHKEKLAEEEQR